MKAALTIAIAAVLAAAAPRETRIAIGDASLYCRDIGQGPPIVVLHGGPDFDSRYLLPDLDRLADAYHLIYYDQRGRGRSADRVKPEDVTLRSELDDIDRVRAQFHLGRTNLLGHSWGAVLALEYALRHPANVSRLILMNPAPVSVADLAAFRGAYARSLGADLDRQKAIVATDAYQRGDPDAVIARYRIHFKPAFYRESDYERVMAAMQAAFVDQGAAGIVKARAVEDRLYRDTWQIDGYDLLPKLRTLASPTLVITADHDFIPPELAAHIAHAMPNARLVTIRDCGHFAFQERPADVRRAIDTFFAAR